MNKFFGPIRDLTDRKGRRQAALAGLALLVGLMALGCSQGSYPLDIFYEMHYQPSYKAHEPPRLSVPESAVPYYPAPQATSFNLDGQHLYEVNCSMCHGAQGKGDGAALKTMMDDYGYTPSVPADLTALDDPLMIAKDAAGVRSILDGGLTVMPSFTKLLTDDELNSVTAYVVNCIQRQNPELCQ